MKITIKGEDYLIKRDTFATQVVYALYNKQNEEIGSLYYCLNQDGGNNYVWLININVKDYYQSRGLGQFLFDLLVNDSVLARADFIEGKFFPTNDHAKPFYEKNGCEIYKEYYETYVRKDLYGYDYIIDAYFTKVNHTTKQEALDSKQELLDKQRLTSIFGEPKTNNNNNDDDLSQ